MDLEEPDLNRLKVLGKYNFSVWFFFIFQNLIYKDKTDYPKIWFWEIVIIILSYRKKQAQRVSKTGNQHKWQTEVIIMPLI